MFLTPYTRKQNELNHYNPFRAMEELERAFFSYLRQLGLPIQITSPI